MKRSTALLVLLVAFAGHACRNQSSVFASSNALGANEQLARYVTARSAEADSIPTERRAELRKLAGVVRESLEDRDAARLLFVCTHNSRRSQMAQIWARVAAAHSGIDNVEVFSGGTESTAFNPRAVDALERAGFAIVRTEQSDNPVYRVSIGADNTLDCWSKEFGDPTHPNDEFIAIMTCSEADRSCPFVPGAAHRIAMTYEDPKAFDGSAREQAAYDERCAQIAREMLLTFRFVNED